MGKIGQAGRAKGAKCAGLLRAVGRRAILDKGFEVLYLSRWSEGQHLELLVARLLAKLLKGDSWPAASDDR
jgi:hypothetical protein